MNDKIVKGFLASSLKGLRVVNITDGEITLEYLSYVRYCSRDSSVNMELEPRFITLYLNHELNENQGLPKEFSLEK